MRTTTRKRETLREKAARAKREAAILEAQAALGEEGEAVAKVGTRLDSAEKGIDGAPSEAFQTFATAVRKAESDFLDNAEVDDETRKLLREVAAENEEE